MRERGQALVEAVVAVPVGLICALSIVDGGIVIRDRIAVAQAATQAARATVAGQDATAAARAALPSSLRDGMKVQINGSSITVAAISRPALLGSAGLTIDQHSSVEVDA